MKAQMALIVALLLVQAAFAQTSEADLRARIIDLHYPPLAEQARISGDVHLKVASGAVTVLSGHPLLAPVAAENAKSLASILGKAETELTYHFAFADTPITIVRTPETVKRGNAFERVILRLFGRKTEKVVLVDVCQIVAAPSDFKTSGATIEIWVYGRTFCLQTDTANLVAQR